MKPEPKKKKPINKGNILYLIAAAVVCFASGFYLYPTLFELIIPHVKGVSVFNTEPDDIFKLSLMMGTAFSLLPFAAFSGWQVLKLQSSGMKAFFALTLLLGPVAAMIIRAEMLYNLAQERYTPDFFSGIHVKEFKAAEFFMFGILGGWILAVAMFSMFKKKATAGSSLKTK